MSEPLIAAGIVIGTYIALQNLNPANTQGIAPQYRSTQYQNQRDAFDPQQTDYYVQGKDITWGLPVAFYSRQYGPNGGSKEMVWMQAGPNGSLVPPPRPVKPV